MSKGFYAKLAVSNMKKNRQCTVPYLLTGIFLVMMFYVLGALAANPDMEKISGSMLQVLNLGIYVVGIFSVILLFYADSFLMKRRKKELGLYNILGMEKKAYWKNPVLGNRVCMADCCCRGDCTGDPVFKTDISDCPECFQNAHRT